LVNQNTANSLISGFYEADEKKRKLFSIDNTTIFRIFLFFGLKDLGCDTNKDDILSGDDLNF
jgi:hypothetical protein